MISLFQFLSFTCGGMDNFFQNSKRNYSFPIPKISIFNFLHFKFFLMAQTKHFNFFVSL
jgi:hypothetical protein